MANCVQFKGPNSPPVISVAGPSKSLEVRTKVKKGVDAWHPAGDPPIGVLIAKDPTEVRALLDAWAKEYNTQQTAEVPPANRQAASVKHTNNGVNTTLTL